MYFCQKCKCGEVPVWCTSQSITFVPGTRDESISAVRVLYTVAASWKYFTSLRACSITKNIFSQSRIPRQALRSRIFFENSIVQSWNTDQLNNSGSAENRWSVMLQWCEAAIHSWSINLMFVLQPDTRVAFGGSVAPGNHHAADAPPVAMVTLMLQITMFTRLVFVVNI